MLSNRTLSLEYVLAPSTVRARSVTTDPTEKPWTGTHSELFAPI